MRFAIEAKVAAKWWADVLREGAKMVSSVGSKETFVGDALATVVSSGEPRLTEEQLAKFEKELSASIQRTIVEGGYWNPSNPTFGSYFRTVEVDYGPCVLLRDAYVAAGGKRSAFVFPIKTMMWVNPGSVVVQYGYGSEPVELPLVEE